MSSARLPLSPEKMTEADVLALLRARFTKGGNGGNGEYAYMEHVRNGAAFNANRTLDAVAISLWPSRGLTIDGFEVKVSRSDWLRELAQPAKAEDACQLVDRFSIVVPRGVVVDGELPPTWGLLEVMGKRLVQAVPASPLGDLSQRTTISREFLVGILRSIPTAVPKASESEEARLREARREGHSEGYAVSEGQRREAEERAQRAEAALSEFGTALGLPLGSVGWRKDADAYLAKIAEGLRAVATGDESVERAKTRVASVVRQLREEADCIERGERW